MEPKTTSAPSCCQPGQPSQPGPAACGCGAPASGFTALTLGKLDAAWCDGTVATPVGEVPRVRTELSSGDRFGAFMVRWGYGRMDYRVMPGLYAVGDPDRNSPALVSANYKLSFDRLRSALAGRAAWVLVLDTDGINVWCAAGKGTFGTDELVRRVQAAGLDRIVSHRTLLVPQLGAPGVSAAAVKERTGFRVRYGPVRAEDLGAYWDAGMKATPEMRRVRFGLGDRVTLVPVELVMGGKYALGLAVVFALVGLLGPAGSSARGLAVVLTAFLGGAVLGPALLPWLPGRAFAVKGAALGVALFIALVLAGGFGPPASAGLPTLAAALVIIALTSFTVMNFTGASTYTSLSGVLREMRIAIPAQAGAAVVGLVLWVAGLLMGGGEI